MNCKNLISLPFQTKIWQVFSSINPVSNSSLYSKNNWNEDFLDHFWIHNSLWVSKHLLDCWIHFGPFWFYQLELALCPLLNLFYLTTILQLIYFLLHLLTIISLNFEQSPRPLNFECCFITHSLDSSPEILNF